MELPGWLLTLTGRKKPRRGEAYHKSGKETEEEEEEEELEELVALDII
jgi:hypothetical protein